jgi:hypothetical protein
MHLVLIGVHRYQQMLTLKGNYFNTKKENILCICRELFGVHPTGINFELYDDIPVESSHMDNSPIDTVRILDIL